MFGENQFITAARAAEETYQDAGLGRTTKNA